MDCDSIQEQESTHTQKIDNCLAEDDGDDEEEEFVDAMEELGVEMPKQN